MKVGEVRQVTTMMVAFIDQSDWTDDGWVRPGVKIILKRRREFGRPSAWFFITETGTECWAYGRDLQICIEKI